MEKVLGILGIEKTWFQSIPGDFRQTINTILWQGQNNKNFELALYLIEHVDATYYDKLDPSLKNNKKIILAVLRQDSAYFSRVPLEFQTDFECAKEALKSMVREKISFLEVEKFLSTHFETQNTKLFSRLFAFYRNYLKVAEYVFHSETERQLIHLKQSCPDIYKIILEKKILEQKGKKIVLSSVFSEFFLKHISPIDVSQLSKQEYKNAQIQICLDFLKIPAKHMSVELLEFLQALIDQLQLDSYKKQQEDRVKQSDQLQEEDAWDEQEQDWEYGLEERLSFCIPPCHYDMYSSGWCRIHVGDGANLELTEKQVESISDRALQNYIFAVKKLTNLGFGFVFQHTETFFRLMDVDPVYGEWVSEWKILKILNRVGKKIGIPEKIISQGNPETQEKKEVQVGCFESVSEASLRFKEIRDTGKINGESIIDPGKKWDKTVLRYALEDKWLFSSEGKWFVVSAWV